jgi:hypothetical protein
LQSPQSLLPRAHRNLIEAIEKEFGKDTPLARITIAAVEKFKLSRSEATVDKYLSVFKAFFNWCDVQGIFHVKFSSQGSDVPSE